MLVEHITWMELVVRHDGPEPLVILFVGSRTESDWLVIREIDPASRDAVRSLELHIGGCYPPEFS